MKTIIIGAGAAGLMAAAHLSACGCAVTVLDGNEKAGKKLYITGKGRCNLTNDCPPDEFLKNVISGGKFLQGVINRFSPSFVMDYFQSLGLPLKTERGRRVFPVSEKASDVTKTLSNAILAGGGEIIFGAKVNGLRPSGSGYDVYYDNASGGKGGKVHADFVVTACGGKSYPSTGSDGSGYNLVKSLGHTVTDLYPALVPFVLRQDTSALKGISLKNVEATVYFGGATAQGNTDKKAAKCIGSGELLFTGSGVSGPVVLTLSGLSARQNPTAISLDLKPGQSKESLSKQLQKILADDGAKAIKNLLTVLLPKSLAWYIIDYTGLSGDKQAAAITKLERELLTNAIKDLRFDILQTGGFSEAVVTSGGVSLAEIDPKTMQSRLCKNLYIVGEMLDIDALTGGYNLQLAWSTALAAAESIKNTILAKQV